MKTVTLLTTAAVLSNMTTTEAGEGFAVPRSSYPVVTVKNNQTVLTTFFETCERRGDTKACFWKKLVSETVEEKDWTSKSFKEYAKDVKQIAKAFLKLNDKNKEGHAVAIWGDNTYEWNSTFFGGLTAKNVVTGVYSTVSPEQLVFLLEHAEAEYLFIEKRENYEKLEKVYDQLTTVKYVIIMEKFLGESINKDAFKGAGITTLTYQEFLARGAKESDKVLPSLEKDYHKDDTAVYIFSSGTTGPPKCVMLSHKNLYFMGKTLDNLTFRNPHWLGSCEQHVMISYLPPCHIAEMIMSMLDVAMNGLQTYFLRDRKKLLEALNDIRPTLFMGVPRVWEKIHTGLSAKFAEATGYKKSLLDWAMRTALHYNTQSNMKGGYISWYDEISMALARRLVFSKLKTAIGLDRAGGFISGAAPLSKEIADFFMSLDIVIHEVYGQSEGTGIAAANCFRGVKNGTVGWVLPGLEVKIANDGEILVRGDSVFKGYFKDPKLTAETIDSDGWLHSGDIGVLDSDNFLSITGRKKDIMITSGGKNITPSNIELALKKSHPLIGDAVLIGDARKFVSAIVSLDVEELAKHFNNDEEAIKAAYTSDEIKNLLQPGIEAVNKTLNKVEKVKKFVVAPRPFTVEDGELTPTLKVKRNVVVKHFAELIDTMYV